MNIGDRVTAVNSHEIKMNGSVTDIGLEGTTIKWDEFPLPHTYSEGDLKAYNIKVIS